MCICQSWLRVGERKLQECLLKCAYLTQESGIHLYQQAQSQTVCVHVCVSVKCVCGICRQRVLIITGKGIGIIAKGKKY